MKIRKEIINTLGGMTIALSKNTIDEEKKYENSPLKNVIKIPLKEADKKVVKCYECESGNTNWCWNCKKPHCDKHAKAIFIPPMINTFCLECAKEFEKLINKLIKAKEQKKSEKR